MTTQAELATQPRASRPASPADAAEEVLAAYEGWHASFREVTRRARSRFLNREWHEWQDDAAERIDLHGHAVQRAVGTLAGTRVDGAHARDRFDRKSTRRNARRHAGGRRPRP